MRVGPVAPAVFLQLRSDINRPRRPVHRRQLAPLAVLALQCLRILHGQPGKGIHPRQLAPDLLIEGVVQRLIESPLPVPQKGLHDLVLQGAPLACQVAHAQGHRLTGPPARVAHALPPPVFCVLAGIVFQPGTGRLGCQLRWLEVRHQTHPVARFLHVRFLQHLGHLLVQLAQHLAQRRRHALHPQVAHLGVRLAFGHQVAQGPDKHRRPQRVLLGMHRIQPDERTHPGVHHGQGLFNHRQQGLDQTCRLQRLVDLAVVYQGQQRRIGQPGQRGSLPLGIRLVESALQAVRELLGQRPPLLREHPPGARHQLTLLHIATLLLRLLQCCDRFIDEALQHGRCRPQHAAEALFKQGRISGHGKEKAGQSQA
jgi:hypothetical protein